MTQTKNVQPSVATPTQTGTQIKILRIYSKNHRVEMKGLPNEQNTSNWQPTVELQANPKYTALDAQQYEVVLTLQLNIKQSDTLSIQVYWEQGGLFSLDPLPSNAEQLDMVLYGLCPNILFPYLHVLINQQLAAAALPPIHLTPLDFIQLYRQHLAQMQNSASAESAEGVVN